MSKVEIEWLPCPFCGCSEEPLVGPISGPPMAIICCSCKSQGPEVDTGCKEFTPNKNAALEAWNKRSQSENDSTQGGKDGN